MTHVEHATLHDPYGGSQTGVPGDAFMAGKAAMGYNGYFAVAQLNDLGTIRYDVGQPLLQRRHNPSGLRQRQLATTGSDP